MSSLMDKISAGAKVVDVRTAEEFADGHFEGAVNIPVDELQARMAEFGDMAAPVIVYCASGARSAFAARVLRKAGYTDVTNAGGLGDMPNR